MKLLANKEDHSRTNFIYIYIFQIKQNILKILNYLKNINTINILLKFICKIKINILNEYFIKNFWTKYIKKFNTMKYFNKTYLF